LLPPERVVRCGGVYILGFAAPNQRNDSLRFRGHLNPAEIITSDIQRLILPFALNGKTIYKWSHV
jgi:hypothetical protein